MKPTIWDLHSIGGMDWRRAKALADCETEAARRFAIHQLLTSIEIPLGSFTRQFIAGYFQQGRPRKKGNGLTVVLAFIFNGGDKLRGRKRTDAIRHYRKIFGCSREEFRRHSHLIDNPHFRAGLAGEPFPPD